MNNLKINSNYFIFIKHAKGKRGIIYLKKGGGGGLIFLKRERQKK